MNTRVAPLLAYVAPVCRLRDPRRGTELRCGSRLEASVFLGFIFPRRDRRAAGRRARARRGHFAEGGDRCGSARAIIGDSIGYLVGGRWGRRMLHGTLGRLPIIKRRLDEHLDDAQRSSGDGRAVRSSYNVAGGAIWARGSALLGLLGAASYHRVETFAMGAGLVLLAVVVVGWAVSRLVRRLRDGDQAS